MTGPLSGIRVVDFGRYIAGPYCAALLADFGAEVIRVEKRTGSGEDRTLMPLSETVGEGAMFLQMNRNKKSLTLDPTTAAGREVVKRLVARADVVIANLPGETLKAMGLDWESVSAINPRAILGVVSAFGLEGPYAGRVGFDGVAQAMSGAVWFAGTDDQPVRAAAPWVDFGTASLLGARRDGGAARARRDGQGTDGRRRAAAHRDDVFLHHADRRERFTFGANAFAEPQPDGGAFRYLPDEGRMDHGGGERRSACFAAWRD